MKTRINVSIDHSLLKAARAYAINHKKTISKLVEEYFKRLTQSSKRKTIIDIVEALPSPTINVNRDLKKKYYESK